MSENKPDSTQVIIAVIGLIGVLGAALIANLDKLFPIRHSEQPQNVKNAEPDFENKGFVNVYYFPSRESDALRIKLALEKKDFIVNIYQAGADLKLAENRPSYIKYKKFAKSMFLF